MIILHLHLLPERNAINIFPLNFTVKKAELRLHANITKKNFQCLCINDLYNSHYQQIKKEEYLNNT